MTRRRPCPAAPGPLEGYAARFDDLFGSLAQRRGFREYLAGLLAPRDRNKTLTALAGAEPVAGAQHPAVQRLQFFLSESRWDPGRVNDRRLELLRADPDTAPHGGGVLVIDDSGDRKDGTKTAHVGRQYLGRYGKTDNGVVTVTTVWADERLYYPVHAVPYTPARHFAKGKSDLAFRTKLAIGAALAVRAQEAGFPFRAVVADSVRGSGRVPRRARGGRAAVRDGAAAAPRDLGPGRGRAYPGGGRPRAGLGRAGYRSVHEQHVGALVRNASRQLLRGAHADGTHLRPDRSLPERREHPLTDGHRRHGGGVRQHRNDDVSVRDGLVGADVGGRTRLGQPPRGFRPAIPYVDAQPRTNQVAGHRAAHYPGTQHRHPGARADRAPRARARCSAGSYDHHRIPPGA